MTRKKKEPKPTRTSKPRHKWREVQTGELRGYGTAARPRRCSTCGIFRFEVGEGHDTAHYYARMRTPARGDSTMVQP